jgi:hypothetical protein
VAVPHALSSVRRRVHAAGLGGVDPTATDGPLMDPIGPLTLIDVIHSWSQRRGSDLDHSTWEVISEMRAGVAAALAQQVIDQNLQSATLRLLVAPDELASLREELKANCDEEVLEHEDWKSFYESVLDGEDARDALESTVSTIAVMG